MNKNDYKKLISDTLESDILNGTNQLPSVYIIINSDSSLNEQDRQDLLLHQGQMLIGWINHQRKNLLIDSNNDKEVEGFNTMIDDILSYDKNKKTLDFNLN